MDDLTGLILTFNEEANIGRTLDRLTWLKRIVVVDSFSTDSTLDILRRYPQVRVYQRAFDTFARQCNYGLSVITSAWVLSLDADYVLTQELAAEIKATPPDGPFCGYFAKFEYCVAGKPLRGTIYPPRQVLYRRSKAIYHDDGHGHRVTVDGPSEWLLNTIWHDDRKPLSRWLMAQDRYSLAEIEKLTQTSSANLGFPDRVRRLKLIAPFAVLCYCLFIQRGLLDGWRGWYYALQRMLVELLLSIRLVESDILRLDDSREI